jgi:nitronate monooxygenase
MELRTRFTDRFGIDVPIVSAPMAGSSDGRLAAAVSTAGGLGTFGAVHPERTTQWVRDQIEIVRRATDRPFGVGFLTPFLRYFEDRFDAVLEASPPVVFLSFGDPEPWLGRAHEAGALVICQVQTLEQARRADAAGADAIVAQGNEAGGHTGTMGLLPLLSAALDACPDTPMLAAGGVADGRALAAVLAMGADGVLVGTGLLAAAESPAEPAVKDLIVASDGGDTVWTHAYDIASGVPWPEGIGERVRRNDFTARWEGRDDELRAQREADPIIVADVNTDPNEAEVLYGPSAAFVDGVHPAAAVLQRMVDGAARRLADTAARFGPA